MNLFAKVRKNGIVSGRNEKNSARNTLKIWKNSARLINLHNDAINAKKGGCM